VVAVFAALLGRYQGGNEALRYYRTENSVLLISIVLQSIAITGILLLIIAPGANAGILVATVGYVITRSLNLYIGERARSRHQIWVYSIQQVFGPAAGFVVGLVLIKLLGQSAEWPLAATRSRNWLPRSSCCRRSAMAAASGRSIARSSDTPCGTVSAVIGGALGWVGLNASRFIVNEMAGVAAAGLLPWAMASGNARRRFAAMLGDSGRFPLAVRAWNKAAARPRCASSPTQRAARRHPGAEPRRHLMLRAEIGIY